MGHRVFWRPVTVVVAAAAIACSFVAAVATPAIATASPASPIETFATTPTEQEAYNRMVALKSTYPNGMPWTNDNYYRSDVLGGGYGCAAFSFVLSDAAFGSNPATYYDVLDWSQVRVGDILRINGNTHSVVVLAVNANSVTVAEGNINSSIFWGRTISKSSIASGFTYGVTRYADYAPSAAFPDVVQGEWYCGAIDWAVENKVMGGYPNGLFGPDTSITRAEMSQVLYSVAGKPAADTSLIDRFADCSSSEWYVDSVSWALGQGVFFGYTGTANFGPDDDITREQLAVVLWRQMGEPTGTGDLTQFPDGGDTDPWAVVAMRWAVGEGLITGFTDTGMLAPRGDLTRAQAAAIMMRYLS